MSAYWVGSQVFDATLNAIMAQQPCILLNLGVCSPNPQKQILDDIIHQITLWRNLGKEVLVGMDANENVDDPKSAKSKPILSTSITTATQHVANQPPTKGAVLQSTCWLGVRLYQVQYHMCECYPLAHLPYSKVIINYLEQTSTQKSFVEANWLYLPMVSSTESTANTSKMSRWSANILYSNATKQISRNESRPL